MERADVRGERTWVWSDVVASGLLAPGARQVATVGLFSKFYGSLSLWFAYWKEFTCASTLLSLALA